MMRTDHMAESIRLTKTEQEELRKKAIEINKALVAKGREPLRDSELIHEILAVAIKGLKLTKSGELTVDPDSVKQSSK